MATAITGTLVGTAAIDGIDATSRLGRGVADAAEQYAYYPDRVNGRVFRLDISAMTFSTLYASGTVAASQAMALSPDGTTLWIGIGSALYTLAAGGGGSPTQVVNAWSRGSLGRLTYDPVSGLLFGCNGTSTRLDALNPTDWSTVLHFFPSGGCFVGCVGLDRATPSTSLLFGFVNHLSPGVYRLYRTQGRYECLVGSGTTGTATPTGSAYNVTPGDVFEVASDVDGRIYYGDGANRIRRLEGGTVTDVAGNANFQGGMVHLPTANRLLVCDGVFSVRKYS